MSLNRRVGLGHTLAIDPTGGTTYVVLGFIVDGWKNSGAKREAIDTSVLADNWKTCGVGQGSPGEITIVIAYDPDEPTTTLPFTTLLNSSSQVAAAFQITYGAGSAGAGTTTHETFQGFVVGVARDIDRGKFMTAEVTIAISGDPGYTHS